MGFPGGTVVKNLSASAGDTRDMSLNPGSGRSPGGGHGNPLQYSCLENPMDSGAWPATVRRVAKSQIWLRWLSTTHTQHMIYPKYMFLVLSQAKSVTNWYSSIHLFSLRYQIDCLTVFTGSFTAKIYYCSWLLVKILAIFKTSQKFYFMKLFSCP